MSRLVLTLLVVACFASFASPAAAETPPRLLPPLSLSLSRPALAAADDGYRDSGDPRPSSGMGLIIAGWIATGLGLLNLATLPICYADFYPNNAESTCVIASAVIGGVGLTLGVPFLIVGYNDRADYKEWKKRNGFTAHLRRTHLAFHGDSALLVYSGEL